MLLIELKPSLGGNVPVKPHKLTPVDDVIRYRLRREDRVVGWMRQESSSSCFYSREGLWWTGRPIKWTHRDRCCGLQDVDNRWLHEGDLLLDVDGPWWRKNRTWLILCDQDQGWVFLRKGWIRQFLSLGGEEIERRRWRWAGVGWR